MLSAPSLSIAHDEPAMNPAVQMLWSCAFTLKLACCAPCFSAAFTGVKNSRRTLMAVYILRRPSIQLCSALAVAPAVRAALTCLPHLYSTLALRACVHVKHHSALVGQAGLAKHVGTRDAAVHLLSSGKLAFHSCWWQPHAAHACAWAGPLRLWASRMLRMLDAFAGSCSQRVSRSRRGVLCIPA